MIRNVYMVTRDGSPTLGEFLATLDRTAKDRGWKPGDLDGWELSEVINYVDAAASYGLDVLVWSGDAVVFDRALTAAQAVEMAGLS